MSSQTKSSSGILIAVLVVAGILGLASGAFQRGKAESNPARRDIEEKVTLEILFNPPLRNDKSVKIEAFVEGEDVLDSLEKFPTTSGWTKTFPIPKGAEVRFSGWAIHGTYLACHIYIDGKRAAKDEITDIMNESGVHCVRKVKK